MKTRSHSVSVTSSSSWTYQNIQDSGDRPRIVELKNTGSVPIYCKLMNKDEAYGNANDKIHISAGVSKTIELENQELAINRVGAILVSGSTAATLIINCFNFEDQTP